MPVSTLIDHNTEAHFFPEMGALDIIIDGPNGFSHRETVRFKRKIVIGRSDTCDVMIENIYVSRRHLEVNPRRAPCGEARRPLNSTFWRDLTA